MRFRVEALGLTPTMTDSVIFDAARASRLWLMAGEVNGRPIGSGHRKVTVRPGQDISGLVHLAYTSGWVQAAVLFVAVPTWGNRTQSYFAPSQLATPVRNGLHQVPLQLVAPARRGHYHIIFAFAPETEPDFVASGTNWRIGRSLWYDGTDIADWTEPQIDESERTGHTTVWWTHDRAGASKAGLLAQVRGGLVRFRNAKSPPGAERVDVQNLIPATAIDVEVR
jgi:hypothetical protein